MSGLMERMNDAEKRIAELEVQRRVRGRTSTVSADSETGHYSEGGVMNNGVHRGVLCVHAWALAEALHFPAGTRLLGVDWCASSQELRLVVEHDALPLVRDGCPAPPVALIITTSHDATSPGRVERSYSGEWV